eukprot:TRINITY_DN4197_c1_g1_i7.p5 TRINITY_DN4197_c1_g1~~TRINITY_DN4197_c1_g1_i7.p5  ORF type:complete len:137 (-),score=2.79 TRINITY_DN4197_c1_g1_i7:147-557(-)
MLYYQCHRAEGYDALYDLVNSEGLGLYTVIIQQDHLFYNRNCTTVAQCKLRVGFCNDGWQYFIQLKQTSHVFLQYDMIVIVISVLQHNCLGIYRLGYFQGQLFKKALFFEEQGISMFCKSRLEVQQAAFMSDVQIV